MKQLLAFVLVAFSATTLLAWGEQGHLITNEAATLGLPNDMPTFFYKAYPELVWLSFDPDRWRSAGESLEALNPPDHFIDFEYTAGLELPPDRFKAIDLFYQSGTLRRHGLANSDIGFLPWHIAELSDLLTTQFRQWRQSRPGSPERTYLERDIIHTAGILGHFCGDAANPHHTTYNYNGWIDPNPNHYATDCDTHARFEKDFVAHAMETSDAVPRLAPPRLRSNAFEAALETIRASNALVEPLYRLDRDGAFNIFRPVSAEARAFTATRLAAGASLLRDLWWSAWRNSATSARERQQRPPVDSRTAPRQKASPTAD